MSTNKTAQFTPGPYELRGSRLLTDSNGVVLADNIGANWPGTIEGQANLFAAAPAMYEALTDAERMWNIARMIDSKHHAGNPISNDLWSDFHRYLMEWHAKRKAALAQAEGKQ